MLGLIYLTHTIVKLTILHILSLPDSHYHNISVLKGINCIPGFLSSLAWAILAGLGVDFWVDFKQQVGRSTQSEAQSLHVS